MKSKFTGGMFGFMGIYIVAMLLTVCTLGIGAPWAACMLSKWITANTIIDGKRLQFDGKGGGCLGLILLCSLPLLAIGALVYYTMNYVQDPSMAVLLTVVSGVMSSLYVFWFAIRMQKWTVKHTHFEKVEELNKEDMSESMEMDMD